MSGKKPEPERLRDGKAYHKEVQADWEANAEGDVYIEMTVTKIDKEVVPKTATKKRTGRLDVFVSDADSDVRAIVEIKNSDWDKMTARAVRRNAKRQARQIWKYIELQEELDGICPGIVFPKRPSDPKRLALIEHLFEEEGIPVVWEDESPAERKAR